MMPSSLCRSFRPEVCTNDGRLRVADASSSAAPGFQALSTGRRVRELLAGLVMRAGFGSGATPMVPPAHLPFQSAPSLGVTCLYKVSALLPKADVRRVRSKSPLCARSGRSKKEAHRTVPLHVECFHSTA